MKSIKQSFILFILGILFISSAQGQLFNEDLYKFGRALHYVSGYYVDSVNRGDMVETAIKEMLKDLDPHSVYLTPEEVKEMNEPLQGNFEGIGIQFNILDDTIYVISPISGGPSEKVGIRPGDRIVKIDGENVAGINISTKGVRDRLLGEKGTKVNVSIKRNGVKELLEFTITRDKIPIFSLDAAYMVEDNIGYIKLNRFAMTTVKEFREAAIELIDQGANSFVLDLRDNGGGYLDQAISLADQFFEEDKLLVYTEGLHVEKTESFSTPEGVAIDANLVVLIDEGSASASEIVAGAIQDWDRGIVVGRRSFGKGLVQKPLLLPDGSMIRLTVARYHTPTGRVIQKPYDDGVEEYAKDLLNRYNSGEFIYSDSIDFPDSLKYTTLTKNRLVYGGGGIMPDVFVPLDTSSFASYYSGLIRKGILNTFVLNYIDENRTALISNYPDFATYVEQFKVNDGIFNQLVDYAGEEGLEMAVNEDDTKSEEHIRRLIKALIARDLWDMSEYFEIMNKKDDGFNTAIKTLKHWKSSNAQFLNP